MTTWGKLTWRHLDASGAYELWGELVDWVEWLRRRYDLTHSKLAACWPNHSVAVEELTALMGGYTAAYQELTTGKGQMVRYHDSMIVWHRLELWSCLSRIRDNAGTGSCTSDECTYSPPKLRPLATSVDATIAADLSNRRIDPAAVFLPEAAMTRMLDEGRAVVDDDGVSFNGHVWSFDSGTRVFNREQGSDAAH